MSPAGLFALLSMTYRLSPGMLRLVDPKFATLVKRCWEAFPSDDPVKSNQGYLLLTVGDVAGSAYVR